MYIHVVIVNAVLTLDNIIYLRMAFCIVHTHTRRICVFVVICKQIGTSERGKYAVSCS